MQFKTSVLEMVVFARRFFAWFTLLVFAFFLSLTHVLAQTSSTSSSSSSSTGSSSSTTSGGGQMGVFQNPLAFNSLDDFLVALFDVIIKIGFPVVVLAIIWTGFLFVKAQGDETGLKEAKRAFFWTVIGALIILGAAALSALIKGTVDEITFLTFLY